MNPVTLIIGIVALGYGLFTLWARTTKPESFRKLSAMQKAYGNRAGTIIHIVSYSVVPIVIGVVALVFAFQGKSFF